MKDSTSVGDGWAGSSDALARRLAAESGRGVIEMRQYLDGLRREAARVNESAWEFAALAHEGKNSLGLIIAF
jgi:hypothetical protein